MDRDTVQNVKFCSKNKFEKLVQLVGFIKRRFLNSFTSSVFHCMKQVPLLCTYTNVGVLLRLLKLVS